MKSYVAMYNGNIMEIFYNRKDAEVYCDRFGYWFEVIDVEAAIKTHLKDHY